MTTSVQTVVSVPVSKKYPQVSQVYSGRPGCACGCRGNYSSNPATITRIVETLAQATEINITTGFDGELIFYGDVGNRTYSVVAR